MADKKQGKNRKYGRKARSPSMQRYNATNRSERNKERNIARAKRLALAKKLKPRQPRVAGTMPSTTPAIIPMPKHLFSIATRAH